MVVHRSTLYRQIAENCVKTALLGGEYSSYNNYAKYWENRANKWDEKFRRATTPDKRIEKPDYRRSQEY